MLASVTGPACADVRYDTSGEDLYRIESSDTSSRVTYAGIQQLSVRQDGKGVRFEARARYLRNGPDGKNHGEAVFVQFLQPNGTFEDRVDDDPDFLTILNQPFAVRLDATTLRDVRALHGGVPFAATSPLGAAAVLRGFLRPAPSGPIARAADRCGPVRSSRRHDRPTTGLASDACFRHDAYGRNGLLRAQGRHARSAQRHSDARRPAPTESSVSLVTGSNPLSAHDSSAR